MAAPCSFSHWLPVRVVEVPVGVDQVFDRITAEVVDGFEDAGARRGDAGIDKQFAVGACQDGDVATRALDDRDIAAQLVELNGRFRRLVADQVHDVAWLGSGFRGTEPAAAGVEASGDRTTDTEPSAGQDLGVAKGHRESCLWLIETGYRVRRSGVVARNGCSDNPPD
jgi:hypothetical protein